MGEKVSIGIVGAGAMGTLLGAKLGFAHSVTMLLRDQDSARRIEREGLLLKGDRAERVSVNVRTDSRDGEPRDLVIIMVKSFDTESALEDVRGWIGKSTVLLSLQNGLAHGETLNRVPDAAAALLGVTTSGATLVRKGDALLAGIGTTRIGSMVRNGQALGRGVSKVFRQAGLPCRWSSDILKDLWSKLLINSAINPVGGLTGLLNGELGRLEETRDVMRDLVQEAVPVAREEAGFSASSEAVFRRVLQVCRKTGSNRCSMLQDVSNGRRTEIDAITGEIVRRGGQLGLATPAHELLARLIGAIDSEKSNGGSR